MRSIVLSLLLAASAIPAVARPQEPVESIEQAAPVLLYWTRSFEGERVDQCGGLITRMLNYRGANYRDAAPARSFSNLLGDEQAMYWFERYPSLERRFLHLRGIAVDEGWESLLAEVEASFSSAASRSGELLQLGGASLEEQDKPYRLLRITRTPPTKTLFAQRLAVQLVDHLESNYPEVDARVFTADLHDPGRILWLVDYYTLNSWTSVHLSLLRDGEYMDLLAQGDGLFLDDETTEVLLLDREMGSQLGHLNLAEVLRARGDLRGALESCRAALHIDAEDLDTLNMMGNCLMALDDDEGALPYYRRALEIEPDYFPPYFNLGMVYWRAENPRASLDSLRRFLELMPSPGPDLALSAHATIGLCLQALGEPEAARESLLAAIEYEPQDPDDGFRLVIAHAALGHDQEARELYDRSIEWVARLGYHSTSVDRLRAEAEEALGLAGR